MKRSRFNWAQSALLAFNAVLAVVLLGIMIRDLRYGPHRVEAAATDAIPASDVRAVAIRDGHAFEIDFGHDMVSHDRVGDELQPGRVGFAPEVAVVARWRSTSRLEVVPIKAFRPATTYRVRLDPALRAADGRRFARDLELSCATPAAGLVRCVVEDRGTAVPAVVAAFDAAIELDEVKRCVELVGPAGSLACRIEAADDTGRAFRIVPLVERASSVPPGVVLRIAPGLRCIGGDLATPAEMRRKVALIEPLRVTRLHADVGGITIDLNRRIPLPEASTWVIEPATEVQVVRHWGGLRLLGRFEPGTMCTVSFKAGFPGRGRARFLRESQHAARVADREPVIRLPRRGSILSARAMPRVTVESVNVAKLGVSIRRAYESNVVFFARNRRRSIAGIFGAWRRTELAIAAPRNARSEQSIDLSELLGPAKRGVYELRVTDLGGRAWPVSKLIQVTDLGVTVRHAPDAVAVSVRGLAKGNAVAGALVRVWTPTNQLLTSGTTQADGSVVLPFTPVPSDRTPFVVEVASGKDRTFVDFERHRVELADEDFSGRPYLTEGLEAWVWCDRGVVRPGEQQRAVIVTRDARGVALVGKALTLRWYDARDKLRRSERRTTGGDGLMTAAFETAASAPTGGWRLEVMEGDTKHRIGQARFAVESFVPDRLEAAVELDGAPVVGGEIRVRVHASWLEGGAAARRPIKLIVRYDHGRFRPKGFEAWSFSSPAAAPLGTREVLKSVSDAEGNAVFQVALPSRAPTQALRARFVAEVVDVSGRVVRAGRSILVGRRDYQLGVRASDGKARVVVLRADGTPVRNRVAVHVELERRRWQWRLKDRGRGRYGYETFVVRETVAAFDVPVVDGRGEIALPAATRRGGYLVVTARSGDAAAEQAIGDVPRAPDRLRVTALDRRVRPGGRVRLAIDAPFGGEAFVTLEGRTIHATKTVHVEAGRSDCDLRIPAGLTQPNVYAVVSLRAPQAVRGAQAPFWIVGGTPIMLEHAARRVDVAVDAPAKVRPGSKVEVTVRAPGARAAVVSLVDEGIRRVTDHADPEPAAWFAARRRLDSRGADTGARLMHGPAFAAEVLAGGSDGLAFSRRLRGSTSTTVRTLALSSGRVELDARGGGHVTFDLPGDYEGRLRVSVVAAGPRVVGSESVNTIVRSPLGLRVAKPRMLVPGDESRFVVTLRNSTGAAGVADLTATPDKLELLDEVSRRVDLAPGQTKTLALRVRAGAARGRQGLRVVARLGNEERSLVAHTTVRPNAVWDVGYHGLAGRKTYQLRIAEDWVRDGLEATVMLDTSPDARLRSALESLLRYPYGCVEQTTSRCFAVLGCRGLMARESDGRADSMLESGIDRLLAMQTAGGGFAAWHGSPAEYPFGTLYAIDFLLAARAAGVRVPKDPLLRAIDRLERLVSADIDLGLRCQAVELLARAGRPVAAWIDRLVPLARTDENRAVLALATARIGDPRPDLLEAGTQVAQARETHGALRSAFRTRALKLRARLATKPGDPEIAREASVLSRRLLRPRSLTTQELGQGVRALADYYARFARSGREESQVVVVTNGERHVLGKEPLVVAARPGQTLRFEASLPVSGMITVSGYRTRPAIARLDELTVERRVLDLETGRPAQQFVVGHGYEVVLAGKASRRVDNLLITDRVPGGFEIEQDRLGKHVYRELRDDRVLFFPERPITGAFELRYRVRAVFEGDYAWPACNAELLYEPGRKARTVAATRLSITR